MMELTIYDFTSSNDINRPVPSHGYDKSKRAQDRLMCLSEKISIRIRVKKEKIICVYHVSWCPFLLINHLDNHYHR